MLLVQSAQAFFVFKILGAVYLIWIGIKALVSAFYVNNSQSLQSSQNDNRSISIGTGFFEGFLTNLLNPKVSMFCLAAFPPFISVNEGIVSAYVLVTAHCLINVIWFSVTILMLSRNKSATTSASFRKWLNSIIGLVFIGFGSKLALIKKS